MESLHVYFKKIKLHSSDKPIIVSEFGGYAFKVNNHVFNNKKEYGYKKFKDIKSFNEAIKTLYEEDVINNIKHGLYGAIYTQVSDIEDEINGLLTYDREVLKVSDKTIKSVMDELYLEFNKNSNVEK